MSIQANIHLRDLLRKLDEIEIPEHLLLSENHKENNNSIGSSNTNDLATSDTTSASTLVEQYKNARDEYLKRRVQRAVLDHIHTYDGNSFAEVPGVPTKEEMAALENDRSLKLLQVQEKAELIQKLQHDIQAKYSVFQSRREYLREMLTNATNSTNEEMDYDDDDDAMIDIDEEELEHQKEKLRTIQLRRAELEVTVRELKQENIDLERTLREKNTEVMKTMIQENTSSKTMNDSSHNKYDNNDTLSTKILLEKEQMLQNELQEKLQHLKDAKDMYDNLRGIVEELSGVRILSIKRTNEVDDSVGERIILNLELLKKHEIELCLQCESCDNHHSMKGNSGVRGRNVVRVVSAKLLTSSTVKSPVSLVNDDVDDAPPAVQLDIPDLDDLVQIAARRNMQLWPLNTFDNENDVTFIVRESLARISMIEKRVELLTTLSTLAVTRIGKLYPLVETESDNSDNENNRNNNSNYTIDQEVVCSFEEEQITVLLRLTPDCPLVAGSCYIDQMVGYSGWETNTLDKIREEINNKQDWYNPVDIVHELKNCVHALIQQQQEENQTNNCLPAIQLPKTPPSLPTKPKQHHQKH